jgi:hypothetical protein
LHLTTRTLLIYMKGKQPCDIHLHGGPTKSSQYPPVYGKQPNAVVSQHQKMNQHWPLLRVRLLLLDNFLNQKYIRYTRSVPNYFMRTTI